MTARIVAIILLLVVFAGLGVLLWKLAGQGPDEIQDPLDRPPPAADGSPAPPPEEPEVSRPSAARRAPTGDLPAAAGTRGEAAHDRERPVTRPARKPREVDVVRGTVAGRLSDQHGRTLAKVKVVVREERKKPRGRAHTARTDENGLFRCPDVACGPCTVSLRALKHGPKAWRHEQVRMKFVLPPAERFVNVDVVVPCGLHVSGFVRSADGGPIAGVIVETRDASWQRARTKSDEDGAFTLGPLADGKCRVWALRTGEYLTSPERTVEAGGRDVVLTMQRGMIITGVVVQSGSGEARPDAKLEAMPRDSRFTTSWGTADRSGRFRMQSLRPGVYDLVARAGVSVSDTTPTDDKGGFILSSTQQGMFGAVFGIQVGPGRATRDVRIELQPGATLRVKVDDRRKDRSEDRVKNRYRIYVTRHGQNVTGRSTYHGNGGLIPVPAGLLRVVITDHEDQRWKQEQEVVAPAGKTVEVAFTLE